MEEILPLIDELQPITNDKNTFYECGFNSKFESLPFEKKLQIICDIVRQSIFPSSFPNPLDENITLIGNCYTAATISKNYLNKLKVGNNIRCVFGKARYFEPDDVTTVHILLLIDDDEGNTYQYDATPFVGFGLGKVVPFSQKLYKEYVEINDEMEYYISIFQEILYKDYINQFDIKLFHFYIECIEESLKYDIFKGYASKCLKVLSKYLNKQESDKYIIRANELKPYGIIDSDLAKERKRMVNNQINKWQEELKDLITSNINIKRQQELCSNIVQERKMMDASLERYSIINNKQFRFSWINPRVLSEYKLNTIMIKPSAYYLNKQDMIKEYMIKNSLYSGHYDVNLSVPTGDTGVMPMLFSHPLGNEYIRSMNGISSIYLVNRTVEELRIDKAYLRDLLGKDIWGKETIWNDGKTITWHPYVTNFIHSTDDYSEAALHYLIGYPEHQCMTRFMYPNKKLSKR